MELPSAFQMIRLMAAAPSLLAAQKLITLKDGIGVRATLEDITANPHNFQFKEL